jgi:DNA-binding MarR family transcriptional regulator
VTPTAQELADARRLHLSHAHQLRFYDLNVTRFLVLDALVTTFESDPTKNVRAVDIEHETQTERGEVARAVSQLADGGLIEREKLTVLLENKVQRITALVPTAKGYELYRKVLGELTG